MTASGFAGMAHGRKYSFVYNKYKSWWISDPMVSFREEGRCSQGLWNLAMADYQMLTNPQKSLILLFLGAVVLPGLRCALRYNTVAVLCEESRTGFGV